MDGINPSPPPQLLPAINIVSARPLPPTPKRVDAETNAVAMKVERSQEPSTPISEHKVDDISKEFDKLLRQLGNANYEIHQALEEDKELTRNFDAMQSQLSEQPEFYLDGSKDSLLSSDEYPLATEDELNFAPGSLILDENIFGDIIKDDENPIQEGNFKIPEETNYTEKATHLVIHANQRSKGNFLSSCLKTFREAVMFFKKIITEKFEPITKSQIERKGVWFEQTPNDLTNTPVNSDKKIKPEPQPNQLEQSRPRKTAQGSKDLSLNQKDSFLKEMDQLDTVMKNLYEKKDLKSLVEIKNSLETKYGKIDDNGNIERADNGKIGQQALKKLEKKLKEFNTLIDILSLYRR